MNCEVKYYLKFDSVKLNYFKNKIVKFDVFGKVR
jgi:hypothetical protein